MKDDLSSVKENVQFILKHAKEQKEFMEQLSEEFKNLNIEDLCLIAQFSLDRNIKFLAQTEINERGFKDSL